MQQARYCLLIFLFTACASADVGPPPVELSQLAPLVADLHVAEALTNEIPIVARDSMREVYFSNVLAEHDFTQARFDSLMWLVRREPAWVDSLYVRVGDIVAKRQANE